MKDLIKLYEQYPEITINIKLSDLIESNKFLIEETKNQLENIIREANEEKYLSIDEVTEILKVNKTTLWRWSKSGYLVPIEVGGKRRYKLSDIKNLLKLEF